MICFMFTNPMWIIGQESNADKKKQEKADRKKQKEEKNLSDWNESLSMASDKQFVFNASHLYTSDGSVGLNPKINFFYVLHDYAVIQFGFEGVFIGGNGVGGITVEGNIVSYKISGDNPKKPVHVELTMRPKVGQGMGVYNIAVKFYGDGYGELLLNSSGLRLQGQITTPDKAYIHEGNKL